MNKRVLLIVTCGIAMLLVGFRIGHVLRLRAVFSGSAEAAASNASGWTRTEVTSSPGGGVSSTKTLEHQASFDYAYMVGGVRYSGHYDGQDAAWPGGSTGDRIRIRYVPTEPGSSLPLSALDVTASGWEFWILVIGAFLLGCLLYFIAKDRDAIELWALVAVAALLLGGAVGWVSGVMFTAA